MKINVSFKQNEEDLYNFIKKKRSPSNYIKDAVEFYKNNYSTEHTNSIKEKRKT